MCLIITFGLGGPDCFNANLSELDRRLKGTFRDATELHTLAAILKVASDLIEDIPSLSLLSYVWRKRVRASPKSSLKMHWRLIFWKKRFNMRVNGIMLGRFSTSMNSPREAGPFEMRLESDNSDWTMTDNMCRTLKTTFACNRMC